MYGTRICAAFLPVRVQPSGRRSFFLDYRLRGKRNRYRLGVYPNLSAEGARAIAQAVAGDIARGTDPQARRKAEREQTERERLLDAAGLPGPP